MLVLMFVFDFMNMCGRAGAGGFYFKRSCVRLSHEPLAALLVLATAPPMLNLFLVLVYKSLATRVRRGTACVVC